jgi:hypothetical protein
MRLPDHPHGLNKAFEDVRCLERPDGRGYGRGSSLVSVQVPGDSMFTQIQHAYKAHSAVRPFAHMGNSGFRRFVINRDISRVVDRQIAGFSELTGRGD